MCVCVLQYVYLSVCPFLILLAQGKTRVVTKTVKQESFFQFFESVQGTAHTHTHAHAHIHAANVSSDVEHFI